MIFKCILAFALTKNVNNPSFWFGSVPFGSVILVRFGSVALLQFGWVVLVGSVRSVLFRRGPAPTSPTPDFLTGEI